MEDFHLLPYDFILWFACLPTIAEGIGLGPLSGYCFTAEESPFPLGDFAKRGEEDPDMTKEHRKVKEEKRGMEQD